MFPESVHRTDMPCEMETATKLTINPDDCSPVVDENANQCVCPLAKFQKFGQCLQYMLNVNLIHFLHKLTKCDIKDGAAY